MSEIEVVPEMDEIEDEDQTEEVMGINLEGLGLRVAEMRSEAIRKRQESGIEDQWREDEEFYQGIDDANRGEFKSSWQTKPLGRPGIDSGAPTGSTIFFNITRPYVDAAAAKTCEILVPAEERGWELIPSPIPEMIAIAQGKMPLRVEKQIDDEFAAKAEAGDMTPEQAQEAAVKSRMDLEDEVKAAMAEAREAARKAQRQIEDWHIETEFNAENRLVIEDGARLGTGVMKGPFPELRKSVAYKGGKLIVKEEEVPVSRRVDLWNCYPDMACGNDVQDGSYFFEKDYISPSELASLRSDPSYIADRIDLVLRQGCKEAYHKFEAEDDLPESLSGLRDPQDAKMRMYEIWYGYMHLTREEFEAAGVELDDDEYYSMPAEVVMVNNSIIKLSVSPFDSGNYPYDFFVWQRQQNVPFGIGVARQIRNAQRMVNAAARNMMDNAGMAGGPMWVFKQGLIRPIDNVPEIKPRKGWIVDEDVDLDDVRQAFTFFEIPMFQQDLQNIIQLGLKLAEDVTGLPLIMQGQQGAAPETVGGMQLLNNNASTVMRRIARNHDDLLTVRQIKRYYEYLLLYSEDDSMKGDFEANAIGSTALVEKDIQEQYMQQIGELVMNPVFDIDPKKWIAEMFKRKGVDPETLAYDDEEWKQIVQNLAQPKQDSSIEVAQIKAEATIQIEEIRAQVAQMQKQVDRESAAEKHNIEWMIAQLEAEVDAMKIEGVSNDTIQKVKGALAQTTMRLRTQRDISMNKGQPSQVAKPPTEPPGRAEEGEAFQS